MLALHQNRFVAGGAIVLAAIALTTIRVLFDYLVPTSSPLGLVVAAIPLAIAVVAILAGFEWITNLPGNQPRAEKSLTVTFPRTQKRLIHAAYGDGAALSICGDSDVALAGGKVVVAGRG